MIRKNSPKDGVSKSAIKERMQSVRSKGDRIHVISYKDGWIVKREGALRADRVFEKKADAIHRAKSFIEKGTAKDVIIHKKDGTIDRWEKGTKENKR